MRCDLCNEESKKLVEKIQHTGEIIKACRACRRLVYDEKE